MTNPTPHGQVPEALEDFEVRKLAAIGAVRTSSGLVERRPIEYRRELEDQFVRGFRAAEKRLSALSAAPTITPETGNSASAQGAAITSESGAVYAPMPRAAYIEFDGREETAWHTPDQMRDYVDRTHALRMQQAAHKASPSDIAKLRHLYANLKNGGVRDTAQAKRIADGLLAPIIERLEQAAPKAAPGEPDQDSTPHLSVGDSSFEGWYESYCPAHKADKQRARDAYAAGMGDPLVRAAPQQEPSQDTMYLLRRLLSNQHTLTGPEFRAELEKIVGEAYQQEAQEPVATIKSWTNGSYWRNYKIDWHRDDLPEGTKLYTKPQPAPAPLSDDLLEALQEIVEDLEQGAIPNANDPWWRKARNAITAALAAQGDKP